MASSASPSDGGPLGPSTYKYLGAVYNMTSGGIYPFIHTSKDRFIFSHRVTNYSTSSKKTSATTVTVTVPKTARAADTYHRFGLDADGGTAWYHVYSYGNSIDTCFLRIVPNDLDLATSCLVILDSSNPQKIQIKTNDDSDIDAINVYTLGYYDNLD